MALLSALVAEIRVENGEDDGVTSANSLIPDAAFLDWVRDFYLEYGKDIRVEASSVASITLVADTQEYSLASDFGMFKEDPYYEDSSGNRKPLRGEVPFTQSLWYNTTTRGAPVRWYFTETDPLKIGFAPVPDSASTGTVYYRYYKKFTAPSVTSESFAMPDVFIMPFKLYNLYRVSIRQKQFGAANGFESAVQQSMRQAKKMYHRRELGQNLSWRQ